MWDALCADQTDRFQRRSGENGTWGNQAVSRRGGEMIVIRILGRLFVFLGLAALGLGVWLWLSGEDITQPAGRLWTGLDFTSYNHAQVIIQRHLNLPNLWDSALLPLLTRPAWEVTLWVFLAGMVLGGLLLLLGKATKKRTSGFS